MQHDERLNSMNDAITMLGLPGCLCDGEHERKSNAVTIEPTPNHNLRSSQLYARKEVLQALDNSARKCVHSEMALQQPLQIAVTKTIAQ